MKKKFSSSPKGEIYHLLVACLSATPLNHRKLKGVNTISDLHTSSTGMLIGSMCDMTFKCVGEFKV